MHIGLLTKKLSITWQKNETDIVTEKLLSLNNLKWLFTVEAPKTLLSVARNR
jgi:hypothetical protein